MRFLLLTLALCAGAAHADLYRWIDPATGKVKFSSIPPPWYGDPERQRHAPPVEVIQYRGTAAPPPKPAAIEKPRAETPPPPSAPAAPAVTPIQ